MLFVCAFGDLCGWWVSLVCVARVCGWCVIVVCGWCVIVVCGFCVWCGANFQIMLNLLFLKS